MPTFNHRVGSSGNQTHPQATWGLSKSYLINKTKDTLISFTKGNSCF